MTPSLYVATDTSGIQHLSGHERRWPLPVLEAGVWRAGGSAVVAPGEHDLVLLDASGLLEELGERIFVAALDGPAAAGAGTPAGATSAHLVRETPWDVAAAARFALDCAAHVLGDAGDVQLPHGPTLAEVLGDARGYLDAADGVDEGRLSLVARLGAARRLQRERERVGKLAAAAIDADVLEDLDALDDPAWATVASLGDAVFAAVEALRHLALPRYTASRERSYDEESDGPPPNPFLLTTPFGSGYVGGGYPADHVPTYVSARDAAERARFAAADRGGPGARDAERAWQADTLEAVLTSE